MLISYEEFYEKLLKIVDENDEFIISLMKKIIDNPYRYVGKFRLTNFRTKLIQNITQSREIQFGDFLELIFSNYFEKTGRYINMQKRIIKHDGEELRIDQLFKDIVTDDIHLLEQKVRDDHDSTKKVGQFNNFVDKIKEIRSTFPRNNLYAGMWFIDDGLQKNKNYYLNKMKENSFPDTTLSLFYGSALFSKIYRGEEIWNEVMSYLNRYRENLTIEEMKIPDFDKDPKIKDMIYKLPRKYKVKLFSREEIYEDLRKEMFPSGLNIE